MQAIQTNTQTVRNSRLNGMTLANRITGMYEKLVPETSSGKKKKETNTGETTRENHRRTKTPLDDLLQCRRSRAIGNKYVICDSFSLFCSSFLNKYPNWGIVDLRRYRCVCVCVPTNTENGLFG